MSVFFGTYVSRDQLLICAGITKGEFLVQKCLDHFVGPLDLFNMFPNLVVTHLDFRGSDQRPILVDVLPQGMLPLHNQRKMCSRFHFEEVWLERAEFGDLVGSAWEPCSNFVQVVRNLNACAAICKLGIEIPSNTPITGFMKRNKCFPS